MTVAPQPARRDNRDMKAAVFTRYGSPDGLVVQDVPQPVPRDDQLLVRICASTVTAGDTEIRRLKLPLGLAIPFRLYAGLARPTRIPILGMEFAGVVEATGASVSRFRNGDAVFGSTGFGFGGYAQLVALAEGGVIAHKPDGVSFEDAATLPTGAVEALTIVTRAAVASGDQVLVWGGSGSIGTFTIQLAQSAGAQVTAVGNATSLELMRSLGATRALDYTKDDFDAEGARYDVILDAIGKCPFVRGIRSLARGGRYATASPRIGQMVASLPINLAGRRRILFGSAPESVTYLNDLASRVADGSLRVIVDRKYPLEEIAEAHRYVDQGHKRGNVVITIGLSDC